MIKKVFVALLCSVSLFVMGACSGSSSSYSASKCEQLSEKAKSGEKLTEADYNEMIDQMVAGAKEIKRLSDEANGDPEKEKAFKSDPENRKMAEYVMGFGFFLSKESKNLSPDNIKKLAEAGEEMKEIKMW